MEKYRKLKQIGEGTYGNVYKARVRETGELVALKETKLDMVKEGIPSNTLREISILQMLSKSDYVVRLLGVEVEPVVPSPASAKSSLYLVFEYIETDLKRFINSHSEGAGPKPLDPSLIQKLMFQLCKGVAHCHSNGVLHRDLKPENLLLAEDKQLLKIADLGIGRAFTVPIEAHTRDIGTLCYRAPEIILGTPQYSTAVDIWSVGCIFAEMVTGEVLFNGHKESLQLDKIFSLKTLKTYDQYLMASSMDGTMKLYDQRMVKRGVAVQTYEGHVNSNTRIEFGIDPSERFLMSGGKDCSTRIWSIKSGQLLSENKFSNSAPSVVCWSAFERQRDWNGSIVHGAWLGSHKEIIQVF